MMCMRGFQVAALLSAAMSGSLSAQESAPTIVVKFKVFDSNLPSKKLSPANKAIVFVRDPVTKKPEFKEAVDVVPVKDDFYEVKVSKGWLVEQLVIEIDDPTIDYNPAIVTKFVSADNMQMYPGASRSRDEFGFQSYVAQLGAYKAFLGQLLDGVDTIEQERRRGIFRTAYESRLRNLAAAITNGQLKTTVPAEIREAKKLVVDVFTLYGISVPDALRELDAVQLDAPAVIIEYRTLRRCCLFGRR